jgi:hypothetical protein
LSDSGGAESAWQRVGDLAAAEPRDNEVAELLLAVIEAARLTGVDAETALRAAAVELADDVRAAGH